MRLAAGAMVKFGWPAPLSAAVAPAPGAGAASASVSGALDPLLRFVVVQAGGAPSAQPAVKALDWALETAYADDCVRSQAIPRTIYLVVLSVVYAAGVAVAVANGLLLSSDWAFLGLAGTCLCLVPAVRSERWAAWGDAAATTIVMFAFDLHFDAGRPCETGRYITPMMYSAMPLAVGILFTPRWTAFAVLCAMHAARSIVVLTPLNISAPFAVCVTCVFGVLLRYMQERRSREHFVRAPRAGRRQPVVLVAGLTCVTSIFGIWYLVSV